MKGSDNIQYFGGKARINTEISQYLQSIRKPNQTYIEPFVGAAWILYKMDGERYAYDKNKYLIAMWQALQQGWKPPTYISKEEYYYIKNNPDEKPYLTGFVGFGCSFAGKWFGGYAIRDNRNYCLNAYNSVLNKLQNLKDVHFQVADYKELSFKDCLIYCDPPYQGTTQYGLVGKFDTEEFWNVMRKWSKNNIVIISEYNAPEDFKCVWQKETKTDIRNGKNQKELRIEKLYTYKKIK